MPLQSLIFKLLVKEYTWISLSTNVAFHQLRNCRMSSWVFHPGTILITMQYCDDLPSEVENDDRAVGHQNIVC